MPNLSKRFQKPGRGSLPLHRLHGSMTTQEAAVDFVTNLVSYFAIGALVKLRLSVQLACLSPLGRPTITKTLPLDDSENIGEK